MQAKSAPNSRRRRSETAEVDAQVAPKITVDVIKPPQGSRSTITRGATQTKVANEKKGKAPSKALPAGSQSKRPPGRRRKPIPPLDVLPKEIQSPKSKDSKSDGKRRSKRQRVARSSAYAEQPQEEDDDEQDDVNVVHKLDKRKKNNSKGDGSSATIVPLPLEVKEEGGESPSEEEVAINPETMSLKDIIRITNSKERKQAKEEKAAKALQALQNHEEEEEEEEEEAAPVVASQKAPIPASHGGTPDGVAIQVRLKDGKIVVDPGSLTVQAQQPTTLKRVVHDNTASHINSMSYMSRLSNEKWSVQDTEFFYKALSQFGTDFTLISQLFPGRQRRHLKNKFTRESKIAPKRVDEALKAASRSTVASYKEMITMLQANGMDIGGGELDCEILPQAVIDFADTDEREGTHRERLLALAVSSPLEKRPRGRPRKPRPSPPTSVPKSAQAVLTAA